MKVRAPRKPKVFGWYRGITINYQKAINHFFAYSQMSVCGKRAKGGDAQPGDRRCKMCVEMTAERENQLA